MHDFTPLIGIALALAIGAASPGPSFVMVARTAVCSSRADGLMAALGMGVGGLIFASAAQLGLQGLLLAVPSLYLALKLIGGLYLAYLGVRIWRGANTPLATGELQANARSLTLARSFALGLTTQISNPKTAIVYASVFAAFLPATSSLTFAMGVAALVFMIEAGWYASVALLLSLEAPRRTYLRYKAWIDRAAGGVMVALGLKLATSAQRG